jgi:hypothetical protein
MSLLDPIIADRANSFFEFFGSFFVLKSICKLYSDKLVRGIAWEQVGFWTAWGFWNIYYYWAVGSAWSWWAGVCVTSVNTVYLAMLIYYTLAEERMIDEWR